MTDKVTVDRAVLEQAIDALNMAVSFHEGGRKIAKEAAQSNGAHDMNDTVTKLMALADEYADERRLGFSQEHAQAKRKALEAELTRLFTPLTREQVKGILSDSGYDTATAQERADFLNGIRHSEIAHGITGEINET